MKYRSHQRLSPGRRLRGNVVHPLRELGRFYLASLCTLLVLIVDVGLHDVAHASASELALGELSSEAALARHSDFVIEPAQFRPDLRDLPSCESSALEPETDGDPAAPEAPGVIQLALSCAPQFTSNSQTLEVTSVTYIARFAASRVHARAPPHSAR